MALDLKQFVGRFIEESRDHINTITSCLLSLEKKSDDPETLKTIYRSIHTIKGASRMVKLTAITEVSHKLEDALDAVIQKRISFSDELADLLLKGIDTVTDMLDRVSRGEEIEAPDDICTALNSMINEDDGDVSVQETAEKTSTDETALKEGFREKVILSSPDVSTGPSPEAAAKRTVPTLSEVIRVNTVKLDELIKLMGEIVLKHKELKKIVSDIREVEELAKQNLDLLTLLKPQLLGENGTANNLFATAESLCHGMSRLGAAVQEDAIGLELLTNQLLDRSLNMRMLPIGTIFDTFHRTVRDMARSYGKDIEFAVSGGETELDKKIIDKIGDTLLHLIRNAVDHGIEAPEERVAAGKNETGTISLSARYDSGNVLIEITDDGRGISIEDIKNKKALEKSVEYSELERLSDSEIINMIFESGFSTSKIITDMSGRGVGLEVVKKDIVETFKGDIRIETKMGKGTSFFVSLPLTMAIMRTLVITSAHAVFAVPSVFVKEVLRIPTTAVIKVADQNAIRLRDEIIPLVFLEDILSVRRAATRKEPDLLILFLVTGKEALGVIVDTLIDQEDMVVKPMPSHMQNNRWVSGVILSEREGIIPVLNVPQIAAAATRIKTRKTGKKRPAGQKKKTILVVDDSVSTREIEKSILESHGYAVNLAGDGVEAYEKTKERRYDLVIVDIEMPRMDGFTLTEKLRKDEKTMHTPIILVTSRDRKEDIRRGMDVGANAYIVKGDFDESNLMGTIKNLLG